MYWASAAVTGVSMVTLRCAPQNCSLRWRGLGWRRRRRGQWTRRRSSHAEYSCVHQQGFDVEGRTQAAKHSTASLARVVTRAARAISDATHENRTVFQRCLPPLAAYIRCLEGEGPRGPRPSRRLPPPGPCERHGSRPGESKLPAHNLGIGDAPVGVTDPQPLPADGAPSPPRALLDVNLNEAVCPPGVVPSSEP